MAMDARIRATLSELVNCHSTPGDECEVARVLLRVWTACGLRTVAHGRYAVSARVATAAGRGRRRPVLLVCAHMDSPGYIVERFAGDRAWVLPLGHPSCAGTVTPVWVKTAAGRFTSELRRETRADDDEGAESFSIPMLPGLARGDRVCFAATADGDATGPDSALVRAPFLDNRLGCALLCELAAAGGLQDNDACEVVLGATASEEMGGFGAPVLARAVQPDAVVCLDATYEAPEQGVRLGAGPVLTLSDQSVLLSGGMRDRLLAFCAECALPMQTEVYTVSGTDAKAFPHQGLAAPVFALLLATRGNHTPEEVADWRDVASCAAVIRALARHGAGSGLFDSEYTL